MEYLTDGNLLVAILYLSGIGFVAGMGLTLIAIILAVEFDEKTKK